MGCGPSTPEAAAGGGASKGISVMEMNASNAIERELEIAKKEEESKVKLLLLGAGESGKSTIFKQMRILYGSPRPDDNLRQYGVIVRSNIVVAIRKLCSHLRNLGLESSLDEESQGAADGTSALTPRGQHRHRAHAPGPF
jgi:hypothetical protein